MVARGGVETGDKPAGREQQFDDVQAIVADCFAQQRGAVVYASGISGTGAEL